MKFFVPPGVSIQALILSAASIRYSRKRNAWPPFAIIKNDTARGIASGVFFCE
jgi:hypothetical protein